MLEYCIFILGGLWDYKDVRALQQGTLIDRGTGRWDLLMMFLWSLRGFAACLGASFAHSNWSNVFGATVELMEVEVRVLSDTVECLQVSESERLKWEI